MGDLRGDQAKDLSNAVLRFILSAKNNDSRFTYQAASDTSHTLVPPSTLHHWMGDLRGKKAQEISDAVSEVSMRSISYRFHLSSFFLIRSFLFLHREKIISI